ncbi:MAG: hypothetical protein ND866_07490, partial [Pyrinomonadaceae bacterium]|nr:hypothetical protein [Pyrinomonadaceae bacterium]
FNRRFYPRTMLWKPLCPIPSWGDKVMQTAYCEMPWLRALRAVALVLAVVLSLEWTVPLGGYAQSNQEPASAPAASVGNQDLPTIQEAEAVEEDRPFYQKWWFWAIVVAVVAGALVAVTADNGVKNP